MKKETYNMAFHKFMSRLLFRYLQTERRMLETESFKKSDYVTEIPLGAVVVPYLCDNLEEWFIGWYRGKNKEGYDLIESVETHEIRRFTNCSFLYIEDEDFTDNVWYRYSDSQYKKVDIIANRLRKVRCGFDIGDIIFRDDKSIELPIKRHYGEKYHTKVYRNLTAVTPDSLNEHCAEVDKLDKSRTNK